MQSPIKLEATKALMLANPLSLLSIDYPLDQSYHGIFIGDDKAHGNFQLADRYPCIRFKGSQFRLLRVHIHERSEHFIDNDVNRDYEVHFVHVPDLDGLDPKTLLTFPKVVIGILYQADSPAKTKGGLEAFSKGIPSRKSLRKTYSTAQQSSTHPITPSHFFPLMPDGTPDFQNWFHYEGSLTSFPFTEDVSWFVIKTEGHVDPKDSADLEAHADQDARELQPLNRRLVVRSF